MFGMIGHEFHFLKDRTRIPMFKRIRQEFQCVEGLDQYQRVGKDKVRIPVFGRIRSEFQWLEQ